MNEEKLEVKEKINKITRAQNENAKINIKKKLTINGISIWRILAYFIIYSVAGYVIETE